MGLNAVQSYPAERVLVAALLGRPASFHELGGRVTEEMFTEPGLRLVFRAFAGLASRGERIDMATVEAEMFRLDHRLYGELNGVSFLSAMLQAVRNDSHIHEYVRLVQREWMLRGCVASLNKRGLEAQQPDVDVMKLLAGVTDDMDGLREHASGAWMSGWRPRWHAKSWRVRSVIRRHAKKGNIYRCVPGSTNWTT